MSRDRRARAATLAVGLALVGFGVASAGRVIGWSNLRPPSSGAVTPIAFDDYALQFYYGQLGARFLAERGVTHGYDPSFMAGYVKMPLYYPSSKPFELALFALSGLDPGLAFNLTAFALLALLPLLAWAAAAAFGAPPTEQVVVVALSTIPHLLVPIAGFYSILEAAGMVSFVFASSLALCVVAALARFLWTGGRVAGGALLIGAPLLLVSHPAAWLLVVVPAAVLYASRFRALPRTRHAWLWGVLLVAVLANWTWIEALLRFGHYAEVGDFYTRGGQAHFAPEGGWLAPLRAPVPSPRPIALIPPVFGAVGLALWWREGRRDLLAAFAPQIAFLFVLAYYGASLGLSAIGPARLTLPLGLALLLPAAHGLREAGRGAARRLATRVPPARLGAARGAAAALIAAALAASGLPARAIRPYSIPELEERNGYTARAGPLFEWIASRTDDRGRLLHEETDRGSHRYYGSHLPALIPLYSGRALAGGPAPHALLRHNYLRFIAGSFRGLHIEDVPPDVLSQHLVLYNVRWVLCWSGPAVATFSRHPGATRVGRYDRFTLFRMEQEPSWFLQGSGRVEARPDRIELRDVEAEGGRIALKFHWLETLRTEPPRPIEPRFELDDPVPFIAVLDPPSAFVILNDGASAGAHSGGRSAR